MNGWEEFLEYHFEMKELNLNKKLEILTHTIFEEKNIDKAFKLFEEIRKLKLGNKDKEILYNFCINMAERCVMEGMFNEAIRFWKIAYYLSIDGSQKIRILDELGFCYSQLNKYRLARRFYKKIVKITKEISLDFINALYQIGNTFSYERKFKKALNYYSQVEKLINKISNKEEKNTWYHKVLLDIFVCHYQLRNFDKAKDIHKKINVDLLPNDLKEDYYGTYGHMEYKRKRYREAKEWYKKALQVWQKFNIKLPEEKLRQIDEKQKEYWQYWLQECEKKLQGMAD